MSTLVWLTAALTYIAGWFIAAVVTSRWHMQTEGNNPVCHQESKTELRYSWSRQADCVQFCKPGCWRANEPRDLSFNDVRVGCGLALIWPAVLFPVLVWWIADRPAHPRLLSTDALAALEREAGIR